MNFSYHKSEELFARALKTIPGGVNSPVRAFKSVKRNPVFMTRGEKAYLWDEDGNRYVDWVGSWGPLILGHSHPRVTEALQTALSRGTSFGTVTQSEIELAELIVSMMPSIEKLRLVNSGTEATMSAIRLARAYTGRDLILKFDGCYHGHADSFLIKAGSGAQTLAVPDSAGVTAAVAAQTLTAEFNNIVSVERLIEKHPKQIAAIILEPVMGNMGCIPPQPGFLKQLRVLCDQAGILLIFDEVMTGFRVSTGGAQELYQVKPDLTTLGKIIGGGLPVGAYGGRAEIMNLIAPLGPVYQAGTLSGNPLAMAAGLAQLSFLNENPGIYELLENCGASYQKEIEKFVKAKSYPITVNRVGSMFTLFFTSNKISNAQEARACNTQQFADYFNLMLQDGIYLPPSQFESAFISAAHSVADMEMLIDKTKKTLDLILKY